MIMKRCAGVLLHPTSLPNNFGIGTFGPEAYAWVDFLDRTQQTIWQVLPLGPTSYGDSPYQSFSTFAGNPYLISLELMAEDNLLDRKVLEDTPEHIRESRYKVDFGAIYNWKLPLLKKAAASFTAEHELYADFTSFCEKESSWLNDFALFMALKDAHDSKAWSEWPEELRARKAKALKEARALHADSIKAHCFMQWLFFRQWNKLKAYANGKGIKIMGDIPIFVAMDSADTWTNPKQFYFDKDIKPIAVAGVPPDYFTPNGQLWGNPLYKWQTMRRNGYEWWIARIEAALRMYDFIRIDHFRGFAAYWEIPAGAETAKEGKWVKGPGMHFFQALLDHFGELPIIAEDLGDITDDVIELRDQFGLPGMKVLQFAFDNDPDHPFLPHNYKENFVAYTGTHDNHTARGWYETFAKPENQDHFRRYFSTDGWDMAWTMIRGIFSSVAMAAIVPLQDILDMGTDCRMNTPGEREGNWQWRIAEMPGDFPAWRLETMTELYGRARAAKPSEKKPLAYKAEEL